MATRTYNNSAGGNWGSGVSWSGGSFPVAGDTADITNAFAGTDYTVAVTDAEAAAAVNLGATNAQLAIEAGGTLTMTGTLSFTAGTLAVISGGELSGATVDDTADKSTIFTDGTLNNVTWLGSLNLDGVTQSSLLTLTGGLSVFSDTSKSAGGTINITGPGAELVIGSSMMLDGTASGNLLINIGSSALQTEDLAVNSGDVLTLGSLTTVSQSVAGSTISFIDGSTGGTIVNQGTLSFTSGAGSIASVTVSNFTNSGTVTLVGGGTSPSNSEALTITPGVSFSDTATGVFNVSDFGVLNIEGPSGAVDFNGQANISGGSAMYFGVFGGPVTSTGGTGNVVLTGASSLEVQYDYQGLTTFSDTTSTLKLDTPGNFTGKVAGFAAAPGLVTEDKIDLLNTTGVTGFGPYTGDASGGTLTVLDNTTTLATIHLVGDYRTTQFGFSPDGNNGTNIEIACFCRGTMILTPSGELPIEKLEIGDAVTTLSGVARSIRWIGRRAYDGRFIAGNRDVLPICIGKDALDDGVPARALWVSPGHSLYIDDALARSEHLLNGVTITQAQEVDAVEYFHIELDSHDVIVADGAPAETYVECDNRSRFANAAEYAALYPDDDRPGRTFCRPCLAWGSAALAAIRTRLLHRAKQGGHGLDDDPGLHLVIDGRITQPEIVSPQHYRFAVPAGSSDVQLASRTSVPARIDPSTLDLRDLGVAVATLVLSDAHVRLEVAHDHPALCEGFHEAEETLRWTDGNGRLPAGLLHPFSEGCTIDVHLTPTDLRYWRQATAAAA